MNNPQTRSSIAEIRTYTQNSNWKGTVWMQVETITKKDSANGKPYWEVKCRDARDILTLRAWTDTTAFKSCEKIMQGDGVSVSGDFYVNGNYGIDAKGWDITVLNKEQTDELFTGSKDERDAIETDFRFIENSVSNITDDRLRCLAETFLQTYGERFQRAAAAKSYHHARRGGLCAHTSQMMRSAISVCDAYKQLNKDLLVTGVLFHDIGKLFETCPNERGFDIPVTIIGEMLGHISIGIEIVNKLWGNMLTAHPEFKTIEPSADIVKMHVLHLIASHHGELEYGSPVEPKTPEAIALHFIDNMDAKLEMFFSGYRTAQQVSPCIYDRVRPLQNRLIAQLPTVSVRVA